MGLIASVPGYCLPFTFGTKTIRIELNGDFRINLNTSSLNEPRREKTGFLHRRKQRRRSALR